MLLHKNYIYCIWIAHLLHNIKEKGTWRSNEAMDLNCLCAKGIFQRVGKTGRTTEYVLLRHKPDKPDMTTT